jgi:hypothetical protein
MPATEVLAVLRPLADALDHAHSQGVVHRDIKPANILFDRSGRPYLADFGIAKALDSAPITASGSSFGTPLYMAPEQGSGRAGHRSDIYSFGCVAFEMLTGSPPYPLTDTVPLLLAHAQAPIPAATDVEPALPPAVNTVLRRALAKAPEQRFGSAREFVDALTVALTQPAAEDTDPLPPDGVVTVGSRLRRRPGRVWLAAAAVVASLAVVIALIYAVRADGPDGGATSDARAGPTVALPAPPAPAPPAEPPVPHGALLYGPVLDGSGNGFFDNPGEVPNPDEEAVRHVAGAVELEGFTQGAYAWVKLDIPKGPRTYVADLDVAARPGSNVELCWSLRWATERKLAWYWCLQTGPETAQFWRYDDGAWVPISTSVPVPGVQAGRTAHVTVVVKEQELEMYLDGAPVSRAVDDQVPAADTIPGLEMNSGRGTGLVRIESIGIWALPGQGPS